MCLKTNCCNVVQSLHVSTECTTKFYTFLNFLFRQLVVDFDQSGGCCGPGIHGDYCHLCKKVGDTVRNVKK